MKPGQGTVIYALTQKGAQLASTLTRSLPADTFLPARLAEQYPGARSMDSLKEEVRKNFKQYRRQIFITAAGIAVRCLAPLLQGKDKDPAVVVMDQAGQYVISLLSGHLGGANALAKHIARLTGGQAVITTATDCAGVLAIDTLAQSRCLEIYNLQAIKRINQSLLDNEPIQLFDPLDKLEILSDPPPGYQIRKINTLKELNQDQPGIVVTWETVRPDRHPGFTPEEHLVLHPRCLVAGLGCNRNTGKQEIIDHIEKIFKQNHLTLASLRCLTSIEAKQNEPGLLAAAQDLGVEIRFFPARKLSQIRVPNPSQTVKRHMGVESVCEATALAAAPQGTILVPKQKTPNVTLAIVLEQTLPA